MYSIWEPQHKSDQDKLDIQNEGLWQGIKCYKDVGKSKMGNFESQ